MGVARCQYNIRVGLCNQLLRIHLDVLWRVSRNLHGSAKGIIIIYILYKYIVHLILNISLHLIIISFRFFITARRLTPSEEYRTITKTCVRLKAH